MMTAASSTPVTNGSNDVEKVPNTEHSSPRFTPVNGRDPPTSGAGGPIAVSNSQITNDEHRETFESWRRHGYDSPLQQETHLQRGDDVLEDSRSQQPSPQGDLSTIKNKRKRSASGERHQISQPSYQEPNTSKAPFSNLESIVDVGVPPSNPSVTAVSDSAQMSQTKGAGASSARAPRNDGVQGLSDARWQEYKSHLGSPPQRVQQMDASDARLAEALQRDAQGTCKKDSDADNHQMEALPVNDQSSSLPTYPRERPQAAVQVAPKRKRVFSNRTKTGCMTCRRRKKKCDEQHPTCKSYTRVIFPCRPSLRPF